MEKFSNLKHMRIFILFLICLFSNSLFAQDTYLRISDRDCLSCFANIQNITKNKKIKYLFPENSKGNRFKTFNESYFNNSINEKDVLFSDELYNKTSDILDDLSGLVFIYDNEVLFSEKGADFTIEKVNLFFETISNFKKIGNLNDSGLSSRYNIRADYTQNELIIIDGMTQKLYHAKDTISLKLDFAALDFDILAKKTLSASNYQAFLSHKQMLLNTGRRNINLVNLTINNNKYYIGFFIPSIILDKQVNEKGETNDVYTIRNNYNYFILDRENLNFSEKIYNSIYTFDFQNENYHYTLEEAIFKNVFYKLNQVIYSDSINKNDPLLSEFKINAQKKKIEFTTYNNNISLFDFQKDEKFNTPDIINSIQFSTYKNLILLQDFPYIIDLEKGNKIKLEWNSNINSFPKNVKYKNLQIWNSKNTNNILFKEDKEFSLKKYTPDFKLISTNKLFFNGNTKKILSTEKYIYLISPKENVYRINNFM